MYTINPNAIIELAQQRYIPNKPKETRWNQQKYGINPKASIKEGKRKRNIWNKQKTKTVMMAYINKTILIITLNVNGLNTPIKRQRLTEWIKKQNDSYIPPVKNSLYRRR